jgi:hypothetical protein
MPCTCNAICDNDCGANQICTGHVPACSNQFSFTWTPVADVTVIFASHLAELESAIDAERINSGRRFNAAEPAYCSTHIFGDLACTNNDFSAFGFSGNRGIGDGQLAQHWDNVKDANNEVSNDSGYGGVVVADFIAQSVDSIDSVIKALDVLELQTKINQTRNACICDTHCNCHATDCGCNGECPNDDYYSYYYYP